MIDHGPIIARYLGKASPRAGPSGETYHKAIRERLDAAAAKVAGKGVKAAQKELEKVISEIWKDIGSGKLKPYDHKNVISR